MVTRTENLREAISGTGATKRWQTSLLTFLLFLLLSGFVVMTVTAAGFAGDSSTTSAVGISQAERVNGSGAAGNPWVWGGLALVAGLIIFLRFTGFAARLMRNSGSVSKKDTGAAPTEDVRWPGMPTDAERVALGMPAIPKSTTLEFSGTQNEEERENLRTLLLSTARTADEFFA